ncbi:MAG: hypothetical protein VCD31_10830 [Alphaproteobacteria bacterium]
MADFFSVLESEALLASLVLAAGSLFDAAGLASVEAFDFEAFVLPLFSLTLPFLLVVDFNPGSYTVRVQFTPQKKDQVVSMPETLNQVRNFISASGDGMIRKQP